MAGFLLDSVVINNGKSELSLDLMGTGNQETSAYQQRSGIIEVVRNGDPVGWVFVDTDFPPYAGISGLLVHPNYKKEAENIGTELIEKSISLAEKSGCNILYAIEWKNGSNTGKNSLAQEYGAIWHRIYTKFGFKPAITNNFEKGDTEICLFNISNTQCFDEFIFRHPLSILSISGDLMSFNGNKAYEMKWTDPQTDDFIAFYLNSSRSIRPKIVGLSFKEGHVAFEAEIDHIKHNATNVNFGMFNIHLRNKSKISLKTNIEVQNLKGVSIDRKNMTNVHSEIDSNKERIVEVNYFIEPNFKIPKNTYNEAIITCNLNIYENYIFPISVGINII